MLLYSNISETVMHVNQFKHGKTGTDRLLLCKIYLFPGVFVRS